MLPSLKEAYVSEIIRMCEIYDEYRLREMSETELKIILDRIILGEISRKL